MSWLAGCLASSRAGRPVGWLAGGLARIPYGLLYKIHIRIFMFITIIGQSPNPENLLYYNDFVSNKLACSVPSQQQFKCNFVQKGQIFGNVK